MSTADLIAMGVEVMAEDDEVHRGFSQLHDLIVQWSGDASSEAAGVREVVRMLRDAADGAADIHTGDSCVEPGTVARLRAFSFKLNEAIELLR